MKRATLLAMAAIVALATGCKKNGTPTPEQSITVSGKIVKMPTKEAPYTLKVVGYQGEGEKATEIILASANVAADGTVSITLSGDYGAGTLASVTKISSLAGEELTGLTFSNDKVKIGVANLELRNKEDNKAGSMLIYGSGKYEPLQGSEIFRPESMGGFVYANGNCNVTGTVKDKDESGEEATYIFDVRLVKGWNKVFTYTENDKGETKITSIPPAKLGLFYSEIW